MRKSPLPYRLFGKSLFHEKKKHFSNRRAGACSRRACYETESAAKGVKGDAPDFNKQKLLRKSRVHIHIKCGL
ncbi:MAG: hypothetical protein E7322_05105 [Clostridiales bacterium]|nr:hypothetical protein [Clostridiales bacterium]